MYGFQINVRRRVTSVGLVEQFRSIPVSNVSDVMSRTTAGGASLRPYHDGTNLAGVAITVKTRPGDNLMIHKAIDLAGPGDVIVVDGGGDLTNSLIGEMMVTYALRRGISGFVLNGSIRDAAVLKTISLPIYAAGVTHRGPYKDGPGEINCAVSLNGMVVEPGDIMIGDEDGVLCVPFDSAEAVLIAAKEKVEVEDRTRIAIQEGKLNRAWVDETLKSKGCFIA